MSLDILFAGLAKNKIYYQRVYDVFDNLNEKQKNKLQQIINNNFNYLLNLQKDCNYHVRDISKKIILELDAEIIAEKNEYLFALLQTEKNSELLFLISKLLFPTIKKWTKEKQGEEILNLIKMFLVSKEKENGNDNVSGEIAKLIMNIDVQYYQDKFKDLLNLIPDNNDYYFYNDKTIMIINLLLKVLKDPLVNIMDYFSFLIKCAVAQNKDIRIIAQEIINTKLKKEDIIDNFTFIFNYQNQQHNKEIKNIINDIFLKLPKAELTNKIDIFLQEVEKYKSSYQKFFCQKIILFIIQDWPIKKLQEYNNFLNDCQKSTNSEIRELARKLLEKMNKISKKEKKARKEILKLLLS